MSFETDYERDYVVLAYFLKYELADVVWKGGDKVFKEVEIGDTENIDMVPGAYIFFAPVTIVENYVGPKTTTHLFGFMIKVRMSDPANPLDFFKKVARFEGKVYDVLISDRGMSDTTVISSVNNELGTSVSGPLCQHRRIGGWRPSVGAKAPEITFDLSIEKRQR